MAETTPPLTAELIAAIAGLVSSPGFLAACSLGTAICNVAIAAMEGQSKEQRAQIWEWVITDQARWRRWLHLDG
jgi:hypothetical protein